MSGAAAARRRSARPVLLWLLTLAPAVLIGVLIARHGVDMPEGDGWGLSSDVLIRARTGRLTPEFLISQHNESRPLVPRLIFLLLGLASRGDLRWQLWLNLGLACAVSWFLYQLARRTVTTAPRTLWALTFLANLVLFTPKHGGIWLSACYIGLEPVVCFAAALTLLTSSRGGRARLWWCALLATAATFSYANGISTWLLLAPVVGLALGWRALGGWLLALAANAAAYFHGYATPAHHPRLAEGLNPGRLAHYELAFVGSPWSGESLSQATAAGAALLLLFTASAGYCVLNRRRGLGPRMLPWVTLGGYSLAAGLMSGIGRSSFGVEMALLDRYVAFTLYLAVSCLPLAAIVLVDAKQRERWSPGARVVVKGGLAATLAVFLALQAIAIVEGVRAIGQQGKVRRYAKSCLLLVNAAADEQCLTAHVYPVMEPLRVWANELDRLRYLHPRLVGREPFLAVLQTGGAASTGRFEAFTRTSARGRHIAVGWAGSPSRDAPADAVMLTIQDSRGRWQPWRLVPVDRLRPDIARARGKAYAGAGWRRPIPAPELPPPPFRIGAWAIDVTTGQIAPLDGTHEVAADSSMDR
jgi:hypothetical protein